MFLLALTRYQYGDIALNTLIKRSTFLIGVSIGVTAGAQTAPDAGSLLQQIQPKSSKGALPNDFVRPKIAPPPEEMQEKSGISIAVRQFQFVGNSLLTEARLSEVVKPWVGKTLDFNELKRVTQAVAQTYRDAGWVVRAYLPKQDITDGVVTIQIVEGRFGKTQLDGALPPRLKLATALSIIGNEQAPAQPINADKIGRAVLLISELPGMSATASLKAGEQDGETDIVLKLDEGKFITGYVGADNTGARSTGAARAIAYVAVNDPLGIGDQAQTTLLHSKGTDYGQLGYSLPIGSKGLRFGANASTLRYSLVGKDFSTLLAKGESDAFGLNLRYPLILSGQSKLYLSVFGDHKRFNNEANQVVVSKYDISDVVLAASGSHYDNFNGGGLTESSVFLTQGRLNLNGSPNQEVDSLTAKTQGSYSKLQYSLSRYQTLNESLNFYATFSGQFANKNLDSAEKFYLGGANAVRAYPSSEGGGSTGQMLNLELRKRLTREWMLRGFYDWGRIKVNQDNDFYGAAVSNQYALKGAGLGMDWTAKSGVNVRVQWAHRIGKNPKETQI
jgi:hemolysin activation/secretion protein